MTAVKKPTESDQDKAGDNEVTHVVCFCDDDRALCGTNVADARWTPEAPTTCVVCEDMELRPCPRCGD